jgi:23S rRNA pseudouridine2605 synthase
MHPRYEVEREYAVRIFGELTEGQLLQLTQGIELEDGPASFDSISPQGGEGANHWYQVVIKEGRNREVRRLFEAFQLPVSRLMRVRFGPVNLPPRVKRGTMLKLEQKQVVELLEWAGLEVPKTPMKQLSQREKDKATAVFVPKVRKQRVSALDRKPRSEFSGEKTENNRPGSRMDAGVQGGAKKPALGQSKPRKSANRRVRGDLPATPQVKNRPQKKSDNNRGRG